MKAISRKELLFLIILFVLAMGLRLVYMGQLRGTPMFDSLVSDAKRYDQWAMAIRDGQSYLEGPYFHPPLYPHFLAGIYALFGHSYLVVHIIQFLIGSVSCLLIYWLGRRTFDATVGKVAAVLAALYGTFIYFEGELLIPVLIVFLNLVLFLAVLSSEERPGWWRWFACGAILGLSAIARPNILLFGAVLWVWILLRLRHRGLTLGRSVVNLLGFVLATLLVILPVTVRNYVVSKDFVPISSQGGINFYAGNNPDTDGARPSVAGVNPMWWGLYHDAVRLAEEETGRSLKASEVSNYWFKRGLKFLRDEPGAAAGLMVKKLGFFWGGPEIANNKDIYFFSEKTALLRILIWRWLVFCPFGIIAPLALAGMVLAWRRREGRWGLMILFIFSYMISVILFFVCARFRLPVVPFLLPFAAYSLVSLFRERRFVRVILPVVLILVFGLLVNLNLAGYSLPLSASSHTRLGYTYLGSKMYEEAIAEFRLALSLNAQHDSAIAGIAQAYVGMDSLARAIEMWERAVSVSPERAEFRFQLGCSYYDKGLLDQAIAQWEETVRLQSEFAQPYFLLGNAYEGRGQYEEAIAHFLQAIRVNPQYVLAHYNLGHLYKKLGRVDEAVEQFQQTIEINPEFGDAYNSLAWLYSQEEINLDEGIQLIERALELDESSGAYWDTLAELYIKKGELERAREIFRRMIQRDPHEPFWRERLRELGG